MTNVIRIDHPDIYMGKILELLDSIDRLANFHSLRTMGKFRSKEHYAYESVLAYADEMRAELLKLQLSMNELNRIKRS